MSCDYIINPLAPAALKSRPTPQQHQKTLDETKTNYHQKAICGIFVARVGLPQNAGRPFEP